MSARRWFPIRFPFISFPAGEGWMPHPFPYGFLKLRFGNCANYVNIDRYPLRLFQEKHQSRTTLEQKVHVGECKPFQKNKCVYCPFQNRRILNSNQFALGKDMFFRYRFQINHCYSLLLQSTNVTFLKKLTLMDFYAQS